MRARCASLICLIFLNVPHLLTGVLIKLNSCEAHVPELLDRPLELAVKLRRHGLHLDKLVLHLRKGGLRVLNKLACRGDDGRLNNLNNPLAEAVGVVVFGDASCNQLRKPTIDEIDETLLAHAANRSSKHHRHCAGPYLLL